MTVPQAHHPSPSPYWHPATETMPREELRAWQWRKLRSAVEHARAHSPFWRKRLPEQIRSLEEYVDVVPLVRKSDLIGAQVIDGPYGELAATSPIHAIRHGQTSGTSGNPPLRSWDSARDWSWALGPFCTALYGMGVRSHHRGIVAFQYGMFAGFWGLYEGLERIGAQAIPVGGLDTASRVRLLVDLQVDVVCCTPSYALRMLDVAGELGIDLPRDGNVKIILAGGEPRPDSTMELISRGFGGRARNAAGTTELGTVNMFECTHGTGHCHITESTVIDEVLDPDTLEPVGYGEPGVRVSTGIGREGMPVFRHWTEDIVVRRPWNECGCGRTWDWLDGGIRHRIDDIRKIGGISVSPVMVEDVLRAFHQVNEFQVALRANRGLDTIVIRVEPHANLTPPADLADRVATAIRSEVGLRPAVEVVEPGTLPRFEVKAARFHDERQS